ncbi:MAG TPA: phosphotransferase [Patescibacteria group bacterium]|nr:phosphotransferase [Patescibacteria group bacterium]
MYFEESNPRDVPMDVVLGALRRIFPGIRESEVRFHYHGTYNVFEVRGEYIFRFPDRSLFNEEGYELIRREAEVLEVLRPHIDLEIPRFEYFSDDPGTPFVGYWKIPGVSLSRCFGEADEGRLQEVAERLGGFLSGLHSEEAFRAFTDRWPSEFDMDVYRRHWEERYERIRKKVYSLLDPDQRDWIDALFTGFISDDDNFRFTPRVVHGDFDTSNVLVDPSSLEVTGVIDFEETGLWDPAADLLFFREGEAFIEGILSSYSQALGPNIEERRRFLYRRGPLIYMLTGVELERPELINAGLRMLKYQMRSTSSL